MKKIKVRGLEKIYQRANIRCCKPSPPIPTPTPIPSPSPSPSPTVPPPNLKQCGEALNVSGGKGTYSYSYDLSESNNGDITLFYDAYNVKDRFIVKQGDSVLYDSGEVSKSKTVKIPFDKAKGTIVTLEVIGNKNGGTAWKAKLDCPK